MSKSTVNSGRGRGKIEFYKRSPHDYWIKEYKEGDRFQEMMKDFKKALLLTFDLEDIYFLSDDIKVVRIIRTTLDMLPSNYQKEIIKHLVLNQLDLDFKNCIRFLTVFPKNHLVHIQILTFLKKHTVPLVLNCDDEVTIQDIFKLERFVDLSKLKSEFDFKRYLRCDDYLAHVYFLSKLTNHIEETKLILRRILISGLNCEDKHQLLILLLNVYSDNLLAEDFGVRVYKDTIEEIRIKLANKMTPYKIAQLQKYKHLLYTENNFNYNIFKGVSPEVAQLEPLIRDLVLKIHA